MSSRPSSWTVRSTAATACSRSVTSVSMAKPPIAAVSASSRSLRRATAATVAPCAASARAGASPIPLLAPVTSATVPWSPLLMPPRYIAGTGGHGRPAGTTAAELHLALDPELAAIHRCAGTRRVRGIHRGECLGPSPQARLVVEELEDDCRPLPFVEDHLELLDRHPRRRAVLVDPADERLHPLRRHIGEPHHPNEHHRLLSVDETNLALGGTTLQEEPRS